MTKVNNNIIVKELNDNCQNKDSNYFVPWEVEDVQLENDYIKDYCYSLHTHDYACDQCTKSIRGYTELYNLIVKIDPEKGISIFNCIIESFNIVSK